MYGMLKMLDNPEPVLLSRGNLSKTDPTFLYNHAAKLANQLDLSTLLF